MPRTSDTGPARFSSRMRFAATNRARLPWRHRTKRKIYQRSSVEKKQLAEKRRKNKADYNDALAAASSVLQEEAAKLKEQFGAHSVQYYMDEIMQSSRLAKKKRSVNCWNVYLRNEVKHLNDALPPGVPRKKASAFSSMISEKWKGMSKEEQEAATRDGYKDLEDHREMKHLSTRNIPIHVFHDARMTLEVLEKEIHALHARTGLEVAMFAARSKTSDFVRPYIISTSDRPGEFFHLSLGQSLSDIAVRFEAYCVSGAQGVVENYVQNLLKLKSDTAALILDRLRTAANTKVPRMYYKNFDENITAKYGVVCRSWPLQKFCSPADLSSRNEVEILYNAWKTGTASFERMSDADWTSWNDARFRVVLAEMGAGGETSGIEDAGDGAADTSTSTPHDARVEPLILQPSDAVPTASKRPAPADNSNASGSKKRKTAPLADSTIINTLTSINGAPITIPKKPRKPRSDIGKKRGPRKSTKTSRADSTASTSG